MKWTHSAEDALVQITAATMARDGSYALEHLRRAQKLLAAAIDQLEEFVEVTEDDRSDRDAAGGPEISGRPSDR